MPAQHFRRVLPKAWGRSAHRTRRVGQLHRHPQRLEWTGHRMVGCGDHAAGQEVGIGERFIVVQHGAGRDADRFQGAQPMRRGLVGQLGCQQRDQRVVVHHPVSHGCEPLVRHEVRQADDLAQLGEELLLGRADRDEAVGGLEALVG